MDLQIILTLKLSYDEWHKIFVDHTAVRAKVCDESRTLVAKANDTTALVTCFDVDMPAFGAMMQSPEFIKLNEPTTEKWFHISLPHWMHEQLQRHCQIELIC